MGNFKIEVEAVGGHGCDRTTKEGGQLKPCGQPTCPDCIAHAMVKALRQSGTVNSATLTHWPTTPQEVVDDILAGTRKKGSF